VKREIGLPLHVAVEVNLLTNSAVAALLSLVSLPVLDWPRRARFFDNLRRDCH